MSAIGSVMVCTHLNSGFGDHQLLLITPATSPRSASSRKHRRHNANLRRYARGRPHLRHRLRCRIANFGFFWSLTVFAVVAIYAVASLPNFEVRTSKFEVQHSVL